MTIEKKICGTCGCGDTFLRAKGPNIGLYCLGCSKWYQWIKKDVVKVYRQRGFVVYPDHWTPPMQESPILYDEQSAQAADSVPWNMERPTQHSRPTNNSHAGYPSRSMEDPNASAYAEPTPSSSSLDICRTCISGEIDAIDSDAVISIFDGVAVVRNRENTKFFGSFRVKYCPDCGSKL